ncbi:MAG: YciI family protein [Rhodospirillum sp.]|nr:YciI family protein [Rhodospirillum sp.]MCF8490367.1 YciI family protein [Rhodospirillum sp.]MCF8501685.1 YciI family protein [Rhodospirillum sp.]
MTDKPLLFVVDLSYKVPMETIQTVLEAHMGFVRRCYDAGVFIASGPKEPRTGGVVIAKARDEASLWTLLAEDPFVIKDMVEMTLTPFHPSRVEPGALADWV